MSVFDSFLFCGIGAEPDLVELRLHELDGLATCHVVVEGYEDFQGRPKPLRFPRLLRRLGSLAPRIHYCPIHLPETDVYPRAPGGRERFARDALGTLIPPGRSHDLIIISDCDEIPRAATLSRSFPQAWQPLVQLGMTPYYLWWNLRIVSDIGQAPNGRNLWPGPVVIRRSALDAGLSAYQLRDVPGRVLVPDAGWHFSFAGSIADNIEKLRSWGHPEFRDGVHDTEANFARARERGEDWDHTRAGGPLRMQFVSLDETYPAYLRAHARRFGRHFGKSMADIPVGATPSVGG